MRKRALVVGVANRHSIAWGIAQALHEDGYDLCLTYADERLESRVKELADTMPGTLIYPLNVTVDEEFDNLGAELASRWPEGMDAVIHSVAFANRDDLKNPFYQTSREGFRIALDISAYSLVALTRAVLPLLEKRQGGVITMSYLGGQRVVPNYNVMGVAKAALEMSVKYLASELGRRGVSVNAISPGPIKTLAAKGIGGFDAMLNHVIDHCPLGRGIAPEEVGGFTAALLRSKGVTGQVLFIDAGYSSVVG